MGLLDGFEKLINEHGSSVILKERIAFAEDKYAFLEQKNAALTQENETLKKDKTIIESENKTLKLNIQQTEIKIRNFEKQLSNIHNTNPEGYVCDHCASPSLKRTGSRPDPIFGDLGVKLKIFKCDSCGKESEFQPKK